MQQDWKSVGSYSTVGLEFSLSVILGMLFGQWLDEKLGTGDWMTIIWFGFGLAAGGRAIYRALQKANRDADRRAQAAEEQKQKYFKQKHQDDDEH